MAYSKNTWANGDVITAAKLNNMENGIEGASAVMVLTADENDTLNKTWQEIHDALVAGIPVVYEYTVDGVTFTDTVMFVMIDSGTYSVHMASSVDYEASSASDYPSGNK